MAVTKPQEVGSYLLLHTLGRGTTGKVKLAEHKQTRHQFAIKIIPKDQFHSHPEVQNKIYREIALMRLMDHPHLVRLHEILESQRHLYIVMEYASHGELFDYLVARGELSPEQAIHIFRHILYGLDYLHSHSICHRDLKLENILLDEHECVKITDFGFARWMQSDLAETSCGSPHYAAPEVILGRPYDGRKADVWSLGVILYTLLTGRLPFEESSLRELAAKICAAQYRMPDFADPSIADLISKLLTVDPKKRPGIEHIKRHPFFRSGIPRGYTFPAPLPLPSALDPIDPKDLDPQILEILAGLGWDDDQKLFDELRSASATMAKSFCLILSNRMSFDSLPWPVDEEPSADAPLEVGELIAPAAYPFGRPETSTRRQQVADESASMYSFAEVAMWDPALLSKANDERKNVSYLSDIRAPLETVIATVQRCLIDSGFEWFYPNDLLILARHQARKTDLILTADYSRDGDLKLTVHLISGDPLDFSGIVVSLAQAVNQLL
jgi:BR serine/threonine kinase